MLTITHTRLDSIEGLIVMGKTGYNKPRLGRIDGAKTYKQAAYAFGDSQPNYPVPSTLGVVEWFEAKPDTGDYRGYRVFINCTTKPGQGWYWHFGWAK